MGMIYLMCYPHYEREGTFVFVQTVTNMLSDGQRARTVSASHVLRARARDKFFRPVVFFTSLRFALYIAQGP